MSKSFKTFLKHTAKDFHNQSVNPPVVRASTIIFKSMQHIRKTQAKAQKNPTGGHYDYGRQGTSTTYILQKILNKLEESYHVFTTPTGFGSVFLAIFSVVRPGDEIIVADPTYSPTRILTQDFLTEYQNLLGSDDKTSNQAQAYLALAKAGQNIAGSTKGLLGATIDAAGDAVPALSKLASEQTARDRALKLTALKESKDLWGVLEATYTEISGPENNIILFIMIGKVVFNTGVDHVPVLSSMVLLH